MTHGLDSPDNRVRSNCDLATECVEECSAACPTTLHVFGQEMTVDQVLDEVEQGMPHGDAVLDDHQVTDPEPDKKWVVAGNRRVPANFQQAYETFPKQTFIARTPFMPKMNDDGEHIRAVVAFTQPYQKVVDHELLGEYEFLGRIYELEDSQRPSAETVHRLRAIIDGAFAAATRPLRWRTRRRCGTTAL
jgi:pyruvate-formate lyase-activating enzyme